MNHAMPDSELSRILITIAAAILILAGMKAAAPFLGPLLFSIFLAVIFGMLLHWFEKKGLSARLALLSTMGIFLAIIAVFILVIAGSFLQVLSDFPATRMIWKILLNQAARCSSYLGSILRL